MGEPKYSTITNIPVGDVIYQTKRPVGLIGTWCSIFGRAHRSLTVGSLLL